MGKPIPIPPRTVPRKPWHDDEFLWQLFLIVASIGCIVMLLGLLRGTVGFNPDNSTRIELEK